MQESRDRPAARTVPTGQDDAALLDSADAAVDAGNGAPPAAADAPSASPGDGPGRPRGRSTYVTRVLTEGSVAGTLWFLAWPQMIEGIVNISDQLADYFWAGRYVGFLAIAALGVAQTYIMLLSTIRQGLDIGMKAMVARAYGMGNVELANRIAVQALAVTIVFVTFVAVFGVIFTESLLRILGVGDDLIEVTSLYMKVHFLGFGLLGVRMMSGAALQAAGDTMTPMKATTLTRAVSLALAPVLMFGGIPIWGWNWFPEMGIPGLALAAGLGNLCGIVWNGYALLAGTSRLKLSLRGYRPDPVIIMQLVRIGWPAALTTAERQFSQLILLRFVVPFGNTAVAAYSLSRRLMQVSTVGAMGFGRASGILVAQNLGAGNQARAKQTVRWAVTYVALIKGVLLGMMFAFPMVVAGVFTNDPELMDILHLWIRIMSVAALGQGIALVFRQSYEIAGDTMGAMVITFIAMWLVEIPAAYLLSQYTPFGHYGIAVGILMAMIVINAIFIPYFFYGRWLRVGIRAVQQGEQERIAAQEAGPRG